ncbi:PIR Superfamily Protein [Plasmodium ovale wallikeri]|uniref:PIR Superfamily Protein n=1 Tax=Plasmodium ovale wallikeri TaxID=864142 RepID=A0A1A9AGC1_PLAOA|nr:PIR Superfamily Protein [Plasmodium ovale wallikeri]SBT56307.1 PIR Superfamily Protein [Plasmodium ovale wallikeri]
MPSNIGKSNLPSIEHYKILTENIQYNTIDKNIDMGNKTKVFQWSGDLPNILRDYIDQYIFVQDNKKSKKSCIDLIYILELLLLKMRKIHDFDDDDMIQNGINNFITMFLKPYGCDESLRYSNEEDESPMNNNKSLYDLCEDIFYIEENIQLINVSSKCQEIIEYIEDKYHQLKGMYEAHPDKYNDILIYNNTNFDKIKSTVDKIKCSSTVSSLVGKEQSILGGNLNFSPLHIFMSVALPLIGFALIYFLLYNLTPLRPWLRKRLFEKKNIINYFNGEYQDLSENTYDYLEQNSTKTDFHVIYNQLRNE